jgi:AraC-like DNA-binding protein
MAEPIARPEVGIHTLRLHDIYQRSPDPDPYARLRLPVHLLALVTAGRASFRVDFETYPCRPGGLLWARPGQVIGLPPPGIDATLVLFEAQFPYDTVDAPAITPGPSVLGTYWQPSGEDSDAIVDEVSQLEIDYRRLAAGEPIPAAVLRHKLAALLLRMSTLEPEGGPGQAAADSELLGQFRAAVDDRYALTRQVDEYARELGCSVRTLTRASLAATGRTAKQLVDDRVALEAKRLLAESDLSVAEVGAQLGFTEATNFGRFFARTAGRSPGAFRARARAEQAEQAPTATPPAQPLLAALSKAGAARGSLPAPPEDMAERGLTVRRTRRRP